MISTNSPPTRHLSLSIPLSFSHTHTGFLSPRSLRFQCCVQRRWCYRVPLVTQTDPELSVAFGSGHTQPYTVIGCGVILTVTAPKDAMVGHTHEYTATGWACGSELHTHMLDTALVLLPWLNIYSTNPPHLIFTHSHTPSLCPSISLSLSLLW